MIDHDIARWIFVIAALCIFTRHKWWPKMQALTRTPQKSLDHPQAGETVDPAAQGEIGKLAGVTTRRVRQILAEDRAS